MTQKKELSKDSSAWALAKIDEDIIAKKAELAKLQKIREEFTEQNGTKSTSLPHRRLPRGYPRELVLGAMQKYEELAIGEVRMKVLEDKGLRLADATARRVLDGLVKEGLIDRREDGVYALNKVRRGIESIKKLIEETKKSENPF